MEETLSYDDVLLVPQYSDIRSRSEVSLDTNLKNNITLSLPVIASPMDTITETAMAIAIDIAGGTSVIHRYNSIEIQSRLVSMAQDMTSELKGSAGCVGAAIGITGDYMPRAMSLVSAGASFLCLDVAHGHHVMMMEALRSLTGGPTRYDAILAAAPSVPHASKPAMASLAYKQSWSVQKLTEMCRLSPTEGLEVLEIS